MNLVIQPFGHIDEKVINHLKQALKPYFDKFTVKKELPLPGDAYNSYRQQFLVDDFMDILKDVKGKKVLGVVNRDLYSPELNFIFGQGRINGKQSIIALDRLRSGATEKMFLDRALKEAVHELGHTFGLKHCGSRMCVMFFSDTLADTDLKGFKYCRKCKKKL